jgi:hypothetical protein
MRNAQGGASNAGKPIKPPVLRATPRRAGRNAGTLRRFSSPQDSSDIRRAETGSAFLPVDKPREYNPGRDNAAAL